MSAAPEPGAWEKRFAAYAASFLTGNPTFDQPLVLKKWHSHRVSRNAVMLANALCLPDAVLFRAKLAGLFHDAGRFRQYRQYRTFRDADSEDHAALSIKEIKCHRLLDGVASADIADILAAIQWHNRFRLPAGESDDRILLAEILQDADKLDIFKVFAEHYERREKRPDPAVELHLPDTPHVSLPVLSAIENHASADMRHMKSLNDFRLLKLSWVFDLHFPASRRRLVALGYIDRIAATLPRQKAVARALQIIRAHAAV